MSQTHLAAGDGALDHGCHRWQPLLDRWCAHRSHGVIVAGAAGSARTPSIQRWWALVVISQAMALWAGGTNQGMRR